MPQDWMDLTRLTGSAPIIVERVRLVEKNIRIEGEFDLPPLAKLSAEDQIFIMAFLRCDGSIKEMERIFGISYPTVKSRLARIAGQFEFVEKLSPSTPEKTSRSKDRNEIINKLEHGEITAAEAIEELSK